LHSVSVTARTVRVTDALEGNAVPVRVHDGERVLDPG
jgi:hypothetical protein